MTDFVELPAFQRLRRHYLDDAAYDELCETLMAYPHAGDLVERTGGLRKLRRPGPPGERGGLRVVYYGWDGASRFWLFTVRDQDDADKPQRHLVAELSEGFDALGRQRLGELSRQAVREPIAQRALRPRAYSHRPSTASATAGSRMN